MSTYSVYLKWDGVLGPATGKYQGWFEVDSAAWDMENRSSGGTPSAIRLRRTPDGLSPIVYQKFVKRGRVKMILEFTRRDARSKLDTAYLRITISAGVISLLYLEMADGNQKEVWSVDIDSSSVKTLAVPGGN